MTDDRLFDVFPDNRSTHQCSVPMARSHTSSTGWRAEGVELDRLLLAERTALAEARDAHAEGWAATSASTAYPGRAAPSP